MLRYYYSSINGLHAEARLVQTLTGQWIITRIETQRPDRGQGAASGLLTRICTDADRTEATLKLTAVPQDIGFLALTQDELCAWYGRHGFIPVDHQHRLERKPREQE